SISCASHLGSKNPFSLAFYLSGNPHAMKLTQYPQNHWTNSVSKFVKTDTVPRILIWQKNYGRHANKPSRPLRIRNNRRLARPVDKSVDVRKMSRAVSAPHLNTKGSRAESVIRFPSSGNQLQIASVHLDPQIPELTGFHRGGCTGHEVASPLIL